MRKFIGSLFALAALTVLTASAWGQSESGWQPTIESAQRLAAQSNRLVMVFIYGQSCPACRVMERDVFDRADVMQRIQAKYVPVRVDADMFPNLARQFGVAWLPTTVVLRPDGQVIDKIDKRRSEGEFFAWLDQVSGAAQPNYASIGGVPNGVGLASPPTVGPASVGLANNPVATVDSRVATSERTDDRYADFFRQHPVSDFAANNDRAPSAAAQPPFGQPAFGVQGPINPQPPFAAQPPMTSPPAPYAAQPPIGPAPASVAMNNDRDFAAPAVPPPGVQASPPAPSAAIAPVALSAPVNVLADTTVPAPANVPAAPAAANSNPPLGLDGYCPVALIETQQWVPGNPRWGAIHQGRTYLFTGPEQQARFLADPEQYAPTLAGIDVVQAVDFNRSVPGLRQHGVFYGRRVFLFGDETSLQRFEQNPARYINFALEATRSGAVAGPQRR